MLSHEPLFPLIAVGAAPPLFALLAIMLSTVVVVSLLLLRVQKSLLVGYFACGVFVANTGVIEALGGVESHDAVYQMAEFGVMMLMFVLGMEFSVSELRFLRRFALVGGGLQMTICALAALAVAKLFGLPWAAAIVIGVAFAMSSTAVSLKTFQDMELSGSPGARFALGVAIFQDLFIIAFLVFLPLLLNAGHESEGGVLGELLWLLLRGGAFMILAWVNAKWIVPNLLHAVARTRSRELFTLTVVGCCVGLAWIGSLLELSLALGAFVAGLAVSESVYKHRILSDILPIKDIFLTLFFVSVGLLIDLRLAAQHWHAILVITAVLVTAKGVIISVIAMALGQINRPALLGGLSLCSAGEFSLLLMQKAGGAGLWDAAMQQSLIASGAISMGLVPALMKAAEPISKWFDDRGWGRRHVSGSLLDEAPMHQRVKALSGHAIICGHGPVGRALNRALIGEGVPTLVIELNADTVRALMKDGQTVLFADAAHEETWALARVENATLVAFTFPDASTAAAAMHHVRDHNPEICVLARARFASDQARLERLGANVVIHDEGEAADAVVNNGLQIAARVRTRPES
ncbi:MAG: cation:proton antiporter [Verrucomicrobiae bacterium]|nr:cation:proton antiporter [Verrucomicrobiae bacterium]